MTKLCLNDNGEFTEHHVVRYIDPSFIRKDGAIDGSAFVLRKGVQESHTHGAKEEWTICKIVRR